MSLHMPMHMSIHMPIHMSTRLLFGAASRHANDSICLHTCLLRHERAHLGMNVLATAACSKRDSQNKDRACCLRVVVSERWDAVVATCHNYIGLYYD